MPLNTNWLILTEGLEARVIKGPVPIGRIKEILITTISNHPYLFWGISHKNRVIFFGSEHWLKSCVLALSDEHEGRS
tara:strand:- start:380 stop:610 length:231 start_codon:yes stop_codon:yes gene_type:complete